jgi:hypothetical protein
MKWVILALGFLCALLYATGAFTPSSQPSVPSASVALSTTQAETASRSATQVHAIDPAGPTIGAPSSATSTDGAVQALAENQGALSAQFAGSSATAVPLPSTDLDHPDSTWGQLLRGASVHSGPSVSSPRLGYATAGAEMQVLERNLGWARIRDPATSREGWIYEEHITYKEQPSLSEDRHQQQAALASDAESGVEQPSSARSSKKSGKKSSKKRWRKHLRFGFRFRGF